jgi:VanZ family protein
MLQKLWPALLWSFIILLLTGLPGNAFPKVPTFWDWLQPDKVVHLFIFGVLAYLLLFGFRAQYFDGDKRYQFGIAAVIITALYGLVTEVLQYYVFIGRSGNKFDFFADGIGALLGWWAFHYVNRKKIRKKTDMNDEFY